MNPSYAAPTFRSILAHKPFLSSVGPNKPRVFNEQYPPIRQAYQIKFIVETVTTQTNYQSSKFDTIGCNVRAYTCRLSHVSSKTSSNVRTCWKNIDLVNQFSRWQWQLSRLTMWAFLDCTLETCFADSRQCSPFVTEPRAMRDIGQKQAKTSISSVKIVCSFVAK
jgi:hypothetical protein